MHLPTTFNNYFFIYDFYLEKGISEIAIEKVQPLFNFTGTITEKIQKLAFLLANSEEGMKGVKEIQFICDNLSTLGLQTAFLDLDVTLARGLNYYTGAIFEVAAPAGVAMGSIGGGGRYDDLTGIFGLKDVSGVGVSFGADRIFDLMETKGLFPKNLNQSAKILFVNFGDKEQAACLRFASELRKEGISTEIYPDQVKLKKQFKYADDRAIPFVAIIGENEINNNTITVKDLQSGEQKEYNIKYLTHMLKS